MPALHFWPVPTMSCITTYKPGLNSFFLVLGNLHEVTDVGWRKGKQCTKFSRGELMPLTCPTWVQTCMDHFHWTKACCCACLTCGGKGNNLRNRTESSVSSCPVCIKIWLEILANRLIGGLETWKQRQNNMEMRSFRILCEWTSQHRPKVQGYLCPVWKLIQVLFFGESQGWGTSGPRAL